MVISLKVRIEMTPEQVREYCEYEGVGRGELREDLVRYVENQLQCSAGLNVEEGATTRIQVS